MADSITVCNLALGEIGEDATVTSLTPPAGSAHARKCAVFYPLARDTVLEAHAWSFATVYDQLTPISVDLNGWAYAFALPHDYIRALALLPAEFSNDYDDQLDFVIETTEDGRRVLRANYEAPVLKYIFRQELIDRWSPMAQHALALQLAVMLCGPLTKGPKFRAGIYEYFRTVFASATAKDAGTERRKDEMAPDNRPAWIKARG